MTRLFTIDQNEFELIQDGNQSFITVRDDKHGIKQGDTLVLQDVSENGEKEEGPSVRELSVRVDFTYYEGLKSGYVTCSLSVKES